MKNIIRRILITVMASVALTACIYEVVPQGGSQTQAQVSASESALKAMIKAFNPAMFCSGAAGYASAYGDHTDFGYPGIALRLEHMLEDIAAFWYGKKTGNTVINDTNMYQHADFPLFDRNTP